jgi:hypothetical protein
MKWLREDFGRLKLVNERSFLKRRKRYLRFSNLTIHDKEHLASAHAGYIHFKTVLLGRHAHQDLVGSGLWYGHLPGKHRALVPVYNFVIIG